MNMNEENFIGTEMQELSDIMREAISSYYKEKKSDIHVALTFSAISHLIFTLAKAAGKDEDLLMKQLSGSLSIMFRNQK